MKKLIILLAVCATALSANAQNKELDALNKKLEKSDLTVLDATKVSLPGTWIDRANILLEASNAYTKKLIAGFSMNQTLPLLGEQPSEIVETSLEGVLVKKYVFTNFDVYVDTEGQVLCWEVKQEFREDALSKAYEALERAYSINPNEFAGKGYLTANNVLNQFNTNGMNLYTIGKKGAAAEEFVKAVNTGALMGDVDSMMIYYSGVTYFEADSLDKALEYLNKAAAIGYNEGGDVPFYQGLILQRLGKNEEAITILEKAIVQFPTDDRLLNQLIDLYVVTNHGSETVVELVAKARALNPDNTNLYLIEGSLWDQMGNNEKAEEAFAGALKLDPDNYIPYMNVGILQYRKGQALASNAEALDQNDIAGYNALMEQAKPYFDKAIQMLEKAHELAPQEEQPIEMLRSLYYPRRDTSKEMGDRFKYFDELYKAF